MISATIRVVSTVVRATSPESDMTEKSQFHSNDLTSEKEKKKKQIYICKLVHALYGKNIDGRQFYTVLEIDKLIESNQYIISELTRLKGIALFTRMNLRRTTSSFTLGSGF